MRTYPEGFLYKKWFATARYISRAVKEHYDFSRIYTEPRGKCTAASTKLYSKWSRVEANNIVDFINEMVGSVNATIIENSKNNRIKRGTYSVRITPKNWKQDYKIKTGVATATKKPPHTFKVGDFATINRPDTNSYAPAWVSDMNKYDGQTLEIKYISRDGMVQFFGEGWWYNQSWLTPVATPEFLVTVLKSDGTHKLILATYRIDTFKKAMPYITVPTKPGIFGNGYFKLVEAEKEYDVEVTVQSSIKVKVKASDQTAAEKEAITLCENGSYDSEILKAATVTAKIK